mmetsp:Transcript_60889/g.137674  ORF Transcript_60889/g.137674 Transcript_60889/m.137674 type:complete len:208 (-) Transcript_60889:133-756(-)
MRETPVYSSVRRLTKSTEKPRIFMVAVSRCFDLSGLARMVVTPDESSLSPRSCSQRLTFWANLVPSWSSSAMSMSHRALANAAVEFSGRPKARSPAAAPWPPSPSPQPPSSPPSSQGLALRAWSNLSRTQPPATRSVVSVSSSRATALRTSNSRRSSGVSTRLAPEPSRAPSAAWSLVRRPPERPAGWPLRVPLRAGELRVTVRKGT